MGLSNYAATLLLIFTAESSSALESFPFSIPDLSAKKVLLAQEQTDFSAADKITRGLGADVFAKVAPSVVKILTEDAQGSGIIISARDNGLLLTNYHVVEGYSTVGLVFLFQSADQEEVTLGTIIKYDVIRDLALIAINGVVAGLSPIAVSENEPEIGDDVHAVGHPLGEDWTYTRGYVSQLRGNYAWQTSANDHHAANIIQTQTPINPGNSGGPLVNDDGELLGVNSFINTEGEGINFAVANSSVREFFEVEGNVERIVSDVVNDEEFLYSRDHNKNGNPDTYYWDYSMNQVADMVGLDEDEDTLIETIMVDEDEDGTAELVIFEEVIEGKNATIYLFDEDQDGTPESKGIDLDQDGSVDRLETIPSS